MDDRRFDSLARLLGSGASRRAILKGLLGIGGAAAVGGAILADSDARSVGTRPTIPTPNPPAPTPTRTPTPSPTPTPACLGFRCGLDCCESELQCCDGECCPDGAVCLTRVFDEGLFVEEETCCPTEQTCDNRCCTGTCFDPGGSTGSTALIDQLCCPAGGTICEGFDSALCCQGETPQCCLRDSVPVCLPEDACCSDVDCEDVTDFPNCKRSRCNLETGACDLFDVCVEEGRTCCPGEDVGFCYRPEMGECCPSTDECCSNEDCEELTDFPNCKRGVCDLESHICEAPDVCELEGRVCCPGETVGFCYSPDEGQCCTNDDCPGCDVCTHGASGDLCHGGCLPSFLSCCQVGDDPDQWFCYHPDNAEACPTCAVETDCPGECHTCMNGVCTSTDARCFGDCGSCQNGTCFVDPAKCSGCEICAVVGDGQYECIDSDDECSGNPDGSNCCNGTCEPCCQDADCPGCQICASTETGRVCIDSDDECSGNPDGSNCCNAVCTDCCLDTDCPGCQICASTEAGRVCIDSDDECSGNPEGSNCCNSSCTECCVDTDCPGCQICASTELGRVCIDSDDECSGNPAGSNCCAAVCTDGACESALTITAGDCIPNCTGKTCGSDGCTGSCGVCTDFVNSFCDDGTCSCAPATCESLGIGCGKWIHDGCDTDMYCGDCLVEEEATTPAQAVTCLAEGDRCVNDGQCCAGLCRGRECRDRGRKVCQVACAA